MKRFLVLLIIIATAHSDGSAVAQETLETVPRNFPSSSTNSFGLVAGDVDIDGDLDILFANQSLETGRNTLYLNQAGAFPDDPEFVTRYARYSDDVALGDLDGDGDLDLVVANLYGSPSTLHYLGDDGYEESSTWYVGLDEDTRAVALADFDQDGYLDIALANNGGRNAVYAGGPSGPSITPIWETQSANESHSLVCGDFDRDGRIDLVFGNEGTASALYLNSVAGLDSVPFQLLGGTEFTFGLATGDLNGDGWLDLVFANSNTIPAPLNNTVYFNQAGSFPTVPDYTFAESDQTRGVALGDVDRDGDLDLAFGNLNAVNRLYLNTGGGTWGAPDWISVQDNSTEDVAFADVTGDGWLDLVCANSTNENKYYVNVRGPLDRTSAWTDAPTGSVRTLALGDVDGDGDSDLAQGVGSANGPVSIFLNEGGDLGSAPVWSGLLTAYTTALAFGDIDGNGTPDLVAGNLSIPPGHPYGAPNVLYLDPGPGAPTDTVWTSDPAYTTTSVALGDVDRDGDLDLVCGNIDDPNTLYLNEGGVLARSPVWKSAKAWNTNAIGLADIDGDGWLDLVCGNATTSSNCVFFNLGGVFETVPGWDRETVTTTQSVATGDLDGDGWTDVVFGIESDPDQIFMNVGGTLGTAEDFTDLSQNTFGLQLGDLDGDGDLDIVCANGDGANTVYMNEDGAFNRDGDWFTDEVGQTKDTVLGDLDLDGDLDVLFANFNAPLTLHHGMLQPHGLRGVGSPTNQLVSHAARADQVVVQTVGDNAYAVDLVLEDPESDPVWLVAEYGFEGETTWYPADLGGGGSPVGPLATSPEGTAHSLNWDVSLAVIDRRPATLRLRPYSPDRTVAETREIPSNLTGVGPLSVLRPEVAASPLTLDFPTVTVGDTVTVDLRVMNTGTQDLVFQGLEFPHEEFIYLPSPGQVDPLPPLSEVVLNVSLVPRVNLTVPGDIQVLSSDPLTSRLPVAATSDIKALEFESRLLSPADEAPLGEAITVIVTPGRDVRVEGGYLYHRAIGAADFLDSIPLSPSEGDFIAVIPGGDVTELGLEYYIRVENSGVFTTDPAGAPEQAVHVQAVAAPVALVSSAPWTGSQGYLDGRSIRVEAHLASGSVFEEGMLHYRQGGETEFQALDLELDGGLPVGVIPDSMVGPRGIEYWVEVATRTTYLMDPPTGADGPPLALPTAVTNMVEPAVIPAKRYRMIGIPLIMAEEFTGTIEAMLFDQPAFGSYDPTRWRCFRYAPGQARYLEHSGTDTEFRPEPGRAYWLVSHQEGFVTTAPVTGYSTPTDGPWSITLAPGWNQVGNPYDFPVAWEAATLDGVPVNEAQAALALEAPVGWDFENQEYRADVAVLERFQGYWIRNLGSADAVLAIPPVALDTGTVKSRKETRESWALELSAESGGIRAGGLVAGHHPDAEPGRDRYDVSRAPEQPGRALSLYFPHGDWARFSGPYLRDHRPLSLLAGSKGTGRGQAWDFDLTKNFADDGVADLVTLVVGGIETVPEDLGIVLVDRVTGTEQDLRTGARYALHLGTRVGVANASSARFRLIVGDDVYRAALAEFADVPLHTALHANRPNPFNPATIIPFSLKKEGRVRISVHDLRGAQVAVLADGRYEAGRHEQPWRGMDDAGHQVAAGIYFVRMRTDDGQGFTRKIMLVK